MYYLRLKDSASSFGESSKTRFTLHQPFDCLVYSKPNLFPLELKSTKGTSFSFKGTSAMIHEHQTKGLTEAAQYDGIIPAFIFNFRNPTQRTYFLHIDDFNRFTTETTKSSINETDIKSYGAIEIEGKIKRIKYTWNIEELIEQIKHRY